MKFTLNWTCHIIGLLQGQHLVVVSGAWSNWEHYQSPQTKDGLLVHIEVTSCQFVRIPKWFSGTHLYSKKEEDTVE